MPDLSPSMWFVIILIGMVCVTIIILATMSSRHDLKKMKLNMPKLPPITKSMKREAVDDDQNAPGHS